MATIFTVHGTFASGPVEGDQWWQRGSVVEEELRRNVASADGQLVIQPIPWSGDNSEMSRREGARELARILSDADSPERKCAIIAHSYGGAMVTSGCINYTPIAVLRNVARVITVGTPYIRFRKSRWLF